MKRIPTLLALGAAICLALGLYFSAARSSSTFDEIYHLSSGYSYLKTGDYRMKPEHPPLAAKFEAIPLLFQKIWPEGWDSHPKDAEIPENQILLQNAWNEAMNNPGSTGRFGHQLLFGITLDAMRKYNVARPSDAPGDRVLTASDFNNDAGSMIFWGRMPNALLTLVLAGIVYFWSRELFQSQWASLVSVSLLCFDPNFIAHGSLSTNDVGISLCAVGAIFGLWRSCQDLRISSLLIFVGFFSLAFSVKYSALFLLPAVALVGAVRLFSSNEWKTTIPWPGSSQSILGRAKILLVLFSVAAISSYVVLWASYGFRYSAAVNPDRDGSFLLEEALSSATANKKVLHKTEDELKTPFVDYLFLAAKKYHLAPEAYLYGVAFARWQAMGRRSYLNGEYSEIGFKTYFLWSFLLKTPILSLATIVVALVLAMRGRISWSRDLVFLLVPVFIYALFATSSNLNIGHRHQLPIYPFLYVLAGLVGKEMEKLLPRKRLVAGGAFFALSALSSLVVFSPFLAPQIVFPHYLSYFNELAGGPRGGLHHLADSNLDWGQDLPELQKWVAAHPQEKPIYLSYFGTADPRYYQIPHRLMPLSLGGYAMEPVGELQIPEFLQELRSGDIIAISVTNFLGIYSSDLEQAVWRAVFSRAKLVDRAGYSILIFQVD